MPGTTWFRNRSIAVKVLAAVSIGLVALLASWVAPASWRSVW